MFRQSQLFYQFFLGGTAGVAISSERVTDALHQFEVDPTWQYHSMMLVAMHFLGSTAGELDGDLAAPLFQNR